MTLTFLKIKVSRAFKRLSVTLLISFAKGTKFQGDPDATSPAHNDAAVHGAADNYQAAHDLRQINPSPQNTKAETVCRNILIDMLDGNVNYLETTANTVAKNAGDPAAGIEVVTRIGFKVAGKGGGKRNVGFTDSGVGWAHAHEEKSRKGTEGHVWTFGTTDAKSNPPKDTKTYYNLEADCFINNVPSGTVIAYCHGCVVPVNQKSTPSGMAPSGPNLAKSASVTSMSNTKHAIFDFNSNTNVVFGEWRYIVIP